MGNMIGLYKIEHGIGKVGSENFLSFSHYWELEASNETAQQ